MIYHRKFIHPKSKTWVVFVHGAGGSNIVWFRQLKEFKKHFNVLLIDLRGHGKSKPANQEEDSGYSFDEVAIDVIQFNKTLKVLISMAKILNSLLPYMWLYKLNALILMPYRRHRESRNVFIKEALKLGEKEFGKWMKMSREIKSNLNEFILREFRTEDKVKIHRISKNNSSPNDRVQPS